MKKANEASKPPKTVFVCSQCAASYSKWAGQCTQCKSWNSLYEETAASLSKSALGAALEAKDRVILNKKNFQQESRLDSGLKEFDHLLGGGYIAGSLILLGGEPGIGKSTLLLELAARFSKKAIYFTGEESSQQVWLRAHRLGLLEENIEVIAENNIQTIIAWLEKIRPELFFIDSIQTMTAQEQKGFAGSISQIKESTQVLLEYTKKHSSICVMTGHITKDGAIAGPKVLEHAVDVVLYFENYQNSALRFVRATKNRYGSTGEVAIFEMTATGLKALPSELDVLGDYEVGGVGNLIFTQLEGSRIVPVEIEVLVTAGSFHNGRRIGDNIDIARIHLAAAICEKYLNYNLANSDIYARARGCVNLSDSAADLALVVALVSSFSNRRIPAKISVLGEVALNGKIRPVTMLQNRLQTLNLLKMSRVYLPHSEKDGLQNGDREAGSKIIKLKDLTEIEKIFE